MKKEFSLRRRQGNQTYLEKLRQESALAEQSDGRFNKVVEKPHVGHEKEAELHSQIENNDRHRTNPSNPLVRPYWSSKSTAEYKKLNLSHGLKETIVDTFKGQNLNFAVSSEPQIINVDRISESINTVSIILSSRVVDERLFEEQWRNLEQDSTTSLARLSQKIRETIAKNEIEPSARQRKAVQVKILPMQCKAFGLGHLNKLLKNYRARTQDVGATDQSSPVTTTKQQRQDRKQEKRYYRKHTEYNSPSQINIQVDVPDSTNYFTLEVNLGTKKTTNTNIALYKTTDQNGALDTSEIKSIVIDKNFSSKFDFWVWVFYNQSNDAKFESIVKKYPKTSFFTITDNLAAYAWGNDKKILNRILLPHNGIWRGWKNYDVTAPITKAEDQYASVQKMAYANAKDTYIAEYQESIDQGLTQEAAKKAALQEAERAYFLSILQYDEDLPGVQNIHDDITKEYRYNNWSKKDYKREYGGKSYRNMKRWNRRKDKKWRRIRDEAFNNTAGQLSIGLSRQIRTGREVYKICAQPTLPGIKLEELQLLKSQKIFVYNGINHVNSKAYQYGLNHKLLKPRWKDFWLLDPWWDGRQLIKISFDEVYRATKWTEHYFAASKKATRDTLIALVSLRLFALGLYNMGTPRFLKRIVKKSIRIGHQADELIKHIKDEITILNDEARLSKYLDQHSEVENEISTLHSDKVLRRQLTEHPELANRYTAFRNNFHGVRGKHVEYELFRDFKGIIALAAFGLGYIFAIIVSIGLCYYDLLFAYPSQLSKHPRKVIKPGAPERWFHNHNPFQDFMQDIKIVFKHIGSLLIASYLLKPEVDTLRAEKILIKQISKRYTIFPSPSQWMMIYVKHAYQKNKTFHHDVLQFLKKDLHLTALPKSFKKIERSTIARAITVKEQIKANTFWKQANRDLNRQLFYLYEDKFINLGLIWAMAYVSSSITDHKIPLKKVKAADSALTKLNQSKYSPLAGLILKEIRNSETANAAQHPDAWISYMDFRDAWEDPKKARKKFKDKKKKVSPAQLTATSSNWLQTHSLRHSLYSYGRSTVKRAKVVDKQHQQNEQNDTFWHQALKDANKNIIYSREGSFLNKHKKLNKKIKARWNSHLQDHKNEQRWWNQSPEKRDIRRSKNSYQLALWQNYRILMHDLQYYKEHKFKVKHALTHQMTIYALSHIKGIEKFPVKLSRYILATSIPEVKAFTTDLSLVRSIKAFSAQALTCLRIQALISTVNHITKARKWEKENHISLKYLASSSNLEHGFNKYFLHDGSTSNEDRKIQLSVNISYAMMHAFQTNTVRNYYDTNGFYRTTKAILDADRKFRQELDRLNGIILDAARANKLLIKRLSTNKKQQVIINQFAKEHPNSLLAHLIRFDELSSKVRQKKWGKMMSTVKDMEDIFEPRHLLADITLSLIAKKVFYSPLNSKDFVLVADFCSIKSGKKERQSLYQDLTHPLASGGRHCRLFYEAALYWDVLVGKTIRTKIKSQYKRDKSGHEFSLYWQNSVSRNKKGMMSLDTIYLNLTSPQAVITGSLASHLKKNYKRPTTPAYYHYHRDLYVYKHRVALVPVIAQTYRAYGRFVTSGHHFHFSYSALRSFNNGRLKPLRLWLSNQLGIDFADDFPLSNSQLKLLADLTKTTGLNPDMILKDIIDDDLPSEDQITQALKGFLQQYQSDLKSLASHASALGLKEKELIVRLRTAGVKVEEFLKEVGTEVESLSHLKSKLLGWKSKLTAEEHLLTEELDSLVESLEKSIARLSSSLHHDLDDFWGSLIQPSIGHTANNVEDAFLALDQLSDG